MIKALNISTQGLLQAERRATDVAKDILTSASNSATFSLDEGSDPQSIPSNAAPPTKAATITGPSSTAPSGGDFGSLIQQFADLRAEENAFKANATAFKKIDETLGSLLDDEG